VICSSVSSIIAQVRPSRIWAVFICVNKFEKSTMAKKLEDS
jgi:hypothetical protein